MGKLFGLILIFLSCIVLISGLFLASSIFSDLLMALKTGDAYNWGTFFGSLVAFLVFIATGVIMLILGIKFLKKVNNN